jgi:hypothetical protein
VKDGSTMLRYHYAPMAGGNGMANGTTSEQRWTEGLDESVAADVPCGIRCGWLPLSIWSYSVVPSSQRNENCLMADVWWASFLSSGYSGATVCRAIIATRLPRLGTVGHPETCDGQNAYSAVRWMISAGRTAYFRGSPAARGDFMSSVCAPPARNMLQILHPRELKLP